MCTAASERPRVQLASCVTWATPVHSSGCRFLYCHVEAIPDLLQGLGANDALLSVRGTFGCRRRPTRFMGVKECSSHHKELGGELSQAGARAQFCRPGAQTLLSAIYLPVFLF